MSGGLAVGLGLSAKAAVDWESAWAGVTKTVDGSASQMADLEQGLRDMAKELPATHGEIAAVAEAAGALGVQRSAIEGFTRTMIDLGETTDLTADQAATSMAQIANIMGTAHSDFDRLGSVLVELGNNGASTESEILELSNRLAAAGKIAGLTEADIFAIGSALASVGVEAEAGGTALSKVFTSVSDAVLDGGDKLETFAEVAGVTASEFQRAYRQDAGLAINDFVNGLGRMIEGGQSLTPVFEKLELTDSRLINSLKSLASTNDIVGVSLEQARGEWEANNALQTEAEKRYATTAAQAEILRNKMVDLGISAGDSLLPAVNGVVGGLGTMADGLGALPGPVQSATVGFAGLSTVGIGLVGVIGTLAPKVAAAKAALDDMGAGGQFVSRNMGRIAAGAGIAGIALAGITYVAGQQAQKAAEADARVREWAEAIRDAGSAAQGALSYLSQLVESTPDLARAMAEAAVTVDDVADALSAGGDEWDQMVGRIFEAGEAAGLSGGELFDLARTLKRLADEGGSAEEVAAAMGEALGDTGEAGTEGAAGLDEFAGSAGDVETAADRAEDAIEALKDAYEQLIGVNLSAEEAMLRVEEAFASLPGTLNENGASLDALTEAGRKNRSELAGLIGGIMSHVQALEEQGASTEEVSGYLNTQRERLAGVMRQAGFTEEQIDSYIATLGLTPENIDTLVQLHGVAEAEASMNFLTRTREARINVRTVQLDAQAGGARTPGLQLASGGVVPQYLAYGGRTMAPRGTDTVPAMLTPGEYVVRKQAVDQVGLGYLDALNTYGAYQTPMGGGAGGGGATTVHDNRKAEIHNHYPKPETGTDGSLRGLRKAAAVMG